MFNRITLSLLIFICYAVFIHSQPQVNLFVDPGITSLDIGSLIVSNDLRGAPQVFCIEILPQNPSNQVIVEGELLWEKPETPGFILVGRFRTKPFTPQRVCNNQLGVGDIKIDTWSTDNDAIAETRTRGKLTGRYEIKVRAEENGVFSPWKSEFLSFLNQTQTFAITKPDIGMEYDEGNVLAEWDNVAGATFEVRANIRKFPSQSLEEALNSGNPLVNNRNVGSVTNVNMRTILEREWQKGDEIVLQVTAITTDGRKLNSNIVNFKIKDDSPSPNRMIGNNMSQLAQLFNNEQLINMLSGEFKIQEIKLSDGTTISEAELMQLIEFLKSNPSLINQIRFENK